MAMANSPQPPETVQLVGVISDTHGLLRPEAVEALTGASLILHAGDIGKPEVLEGLRAIAPTVAVRGNIDKDAWAAAIPERQTIKVGNIQIHLLHIVKELMLKGLMLDPQQTDIRVVISGHSHKPQIEEQEGILFLNPGSAGPRRFKLPISVAHLYVNGTAVSAKIVELQI